MAVINKLMVALLCILAMAIVVMAFRHGQDQFGFAFGVICGMIAVVAASLTTAMIATNHNGSWIRIVFAVLFFAFAMLFIAFPTDFNFRMPRSIDDYETPQGAHSFPDFQGDPFDPGTFALPDSEPIEFGLELKLQEDDRVLVVGAVKTHKELHDYRKKLLSDRPELDRTSLFWKVHVADTGDFYDMYLDEEFQFLIRLGMEIDELNK